MSQICFKNVTPYNLEETLFCGQCFRWQKTPLGYCGVVGSRRVTLTQQQSDIVVLGADESDTDFWCDYLAIQEDYTGIQNRFSKSKQLGQCVTYAGGIRVLHQPFLETLLTFIISQNNNIPRITAIADRLCTYFGTDMGGWYAFPTLEQLQEKTVEDFAVLRAGFRAKYLVDAVEKLAKEQISEEELRALSLDDARNMLCTIKGVGPKVADCVMLFGLGKTQSFPRDVWMNRAMKQLFPKGLPACTKGYEGIAQQYIFYFARANLKNT